MLLLLHLLSLSVLTTKAATHEDLTRLHEKLMDNYNKDLRPTFNLTNPTTLYLGFHLHSLNEFEEKTGKLSVSGFFLIYWHDFQMEWNPADFGGIDHTFLPQSSVWTPDIILYNPYNDIEPPGFDKLKVRIGNTGYIIWSPMNVFEVLCPAFVTYYPFDQQICSMAFGPPMMTVSDVVINLVSNDIETDYYFPSGIWELKNASCEIFAVENTQTVNLTIVIQRRPMFQVINTLVPFSILGFLNTMVFLLPAESGERVGFSITVFLAIAVFMSIVTDTLPGTSEPSFPRLCYLLAVEFCINALVTVCTILVLRLHHKPKDQTVPSWLQAIICFCVCSNCKDKQLNQSKITNIENKSTICIDTVVQDSERNNTGCEKEVELNSKSAGNENKRTNEKRENNCGKTSWQIVAHILDMFLFVFFIVISGLNKLVAYFIFT